MRELQPQQKNFLGYATWCNSTCSEMKTFLSSLSVCCLLHPKHKHCISAKRLSQLVQIGVEYYTNQNEIT